MHLSPSQLMEWCKCPRKWYYSNVCNLGYPETDMALSIGKILHQFLENYHMGAELQSLLDDFEISCIGMKIEDIELVRNMMRQYVEFDRKSVAPLVIPSSKEQLILTEKDYAIRYAGIDFEFRPDLLFQDESGRITIVDHKTAANNWTLEDFYSNLQGKLYAFFISRIFSGNPVSVMFNILYKKFARKPDLCKGKRKDDPMRVSKAKCTTTRELYLAAIKEVNGDEADYQDFLSTIPNHVFNERFRISDYRLHSISEILGDICERITYDRQRFPIGRNDYTCNQCCFKDICANCDTLQEVLQYVETSCWSGLRKELTNDKKYDKIEE